MLNAKFFKMFNVNALLIIVIGLLMKIENK